jgi:hypothetical protein
MGDHHRATAIWFQIPAGYSGGFSQPTQALDLFIKSSTSLIFCVLEKNNFSCSILFVDDETFFMKERLSSN